MDRGTIQQLHLDFACVCIEINAEEEVEKVIKVDIGDDQMVEVDVVIRWCPQKCKKCKQFGHTCHPNSDVELTKQI